MARAMAIPVRTYQHFEAGKKKINVDQVFIFARATDSDPYALIIAAVLGAPLLAVRCADNKLLAAFVMNLDTFNSELGDCITDLNAVTIQTTFRRALDELTIQALAPKPPKPRFPRSLLRRRRPEQPPKSTADHDAE